MKKAVVAFSGGLDTSFTVVHLIEKGYEVATIAVDTGGFAPEEHTKLAEFSKTLGAKEHKTVDAREEMFDLFAAYIIKGNILRGNVYPLCVGAERVIQAQKVIEYAEEYGAECVAHGCTGAGNDQVRFDVAFRCLKPEVEIIAPIRECALSRAEEIDFLKQHGIDFPTDKKTYSINRGILGTSIGGGATHDSWQSLPEEAYVITAPLAAAPEQPEELVIRFEQGLPSALQDAAIPGYLLLQKLNELGGKHSIGRGMHLGDTILGIKGRLAFEAPGMEILITAHRELEKLVLTKWQASVKEQLAQQYGSLLHEGAWFDPVMRDIECALDSSQMRVTGDVRVALHKGRVTVQGYRSSYSLMSAGAIYGEESSLWNGRDAEGFCKIIGMQSILANKVAKN